MFIESPRFPDQIAYGAAGGPIYSTDIVVVNSGFEYRNANWALPLAIYDVAHGIQSQAEIDALIVFFRMAKGRAHSFRFKDFMDYQVTVAQGTLTNTTGLIYQLNKTYTSGDLTEVRPIKKPVAAGFQLFQNGSLMSSGYAINTTTGLVTLDSAQTNLTWSGEFDVPCRFDTDKMSVSIDFYKVYSWGQIPIVEVRL